MTRRKDSRDVNGVTPWVWVVSFERAADLGPSLSGDAA